MYTNPLSSSMLCFFLIFLNKVFIYLFTHLFILSQDLMYLASFPHGLELVVLLPPPGRVTNVFHHTQQHILLEKMTESRSFGNDRRTEVLTSREHMECRMHRVRERTSVFSSS